MNAIASPARFDAPSQHRRSLIAKVHVARTQLAMHEDDYRQLLFDTTGKMSAADCADAELAAMVKAMEQRGFKPKPRGGKRGADHPVARKARAMWISLYHLGAVRSASEQSLEAFAKRQLRVEKLQWSDQSRGYKLIEALKDMAVREGWSQATGRAEGAHKIRLLQRNLCEAIVAKLVAAGLADAEWDVPTAAFRLCGEEITDFDFDGIQVERLGRLAKALGAKLREAGR